LLSGTVTQSLTPSKLSAAEAPCGGARGAGDGAGLAAGAVAGGRAARLVEAPRADQARRRGRVDRERTSTVFGDPVAPAVVAVTVTVAA
jgi:hypothetical protein